jgi:hypothetical protein
MPEPKCTSHGSGRLAHNVIRQTTAKLLKISKSESNDKQQQRKALIYYSSAQREHKRRRSFVVVAM